MIRHWRRPPYASRRDTPLHGVSDQGAILAQPRSDRAQAFEKHRRHRPRRSSDRARRRPMPNPATMYGAPVAAPAGSRPYIRRSSVEDPETVGKEQRCLSLCWTCIQTARGRLQDREQHTVGLVGIDGTLTFSTSSIRSRSSSRARSTATYQIERPTDSQ